MIKIPNTSRKWLQPNNSDLFGTIYATKNMNFDNEGYMRLSNATKAIIDPTVDADWDNVGAIGQYDDGTEKFLFTWDEPFKSNLYGLLADYPQQLTNANIPAGSSRNALTIFDDRLVGTDGTGVAYWDGSDWTDTNITLTNNGQHQLVNFMSQGALAVSDVNTVKLYASPFSATPALIQTLIIPAEFEITGMAYLNQKLFIGTRSLQGLHAFLFVWNGSGSGAQELYEVDGNMIFDVCSHRSTVVFLVSNGELMYYTGGGVSPLPNGKFPIYFENMSLTDYTNINLYKNCLKSNGDLIYINFSNTENGTNGSGARLLDQPDGIWCYDDKVGLYHRYANSISLVDIKTVAAANVNVTTNIITTTNVPPTGTEVYFNDYGTSGADIGLTEKKYFTIKVSATEFKLATTKANALAGIAVDLTGTPTLVYQFNFFPQIDFGASISSRAFSLAVLELSTARPHWGVDALWSSEIRKRTLSTTNDEHLLTTSPYLENRGWYISPKVLSSGATDTHNTLTLKFKKFDNELDKIIIKYRVKDDDKRFIDEGQWIGDWTSTNTFTSTQTDLANAQVGDEIEILGGAGGGLLAHITQISLNTGTYTITIDETFDNYASGDKCYFIYRNWIKLATISYGDGEANDGFFQREINDTGKFIQIKLDIRGVRTTIEELQINNTTQLPN